MRGPGSPLGGRKTPERWGLSQTSTSSARSSGSSLCSSLAMAAKAAFRPCFAPQATDSSVHFSASSHQDFKSCPSSIPPASPSTSSDTSYGRGHKSSSARRSGRGLFGSGTNNNSRHTTTTTSHQIANMRFNMAEIHKATNNFSPALKIGQGGFGTVYRGTLDDGTVVAVKRAKKSIYDNHLGAEFQSEIHTLSRVEHLNLVRFLGYVECEDERVVVVEYVPNGTLRQHLDGKRLDLAARLDIAIDVAHAVTYLHMYTGNEEVYEWECDSGVRPKSSTEPSNKSRNRENPGASFSMFSSYQTRETQHEEMC